MKFLITRRINEWWVVLMYFIIIHKLLELIITATRRRHYSLEFNSLHQNWKARKTSSKLSSIDSSTAVYMYGTLMYWFWYIILVPFAVIFFSNRQKCPLLYILQIQKNASCKPENYDLEHAWLYCRILTYNNYTCMEAINSILMLFCNHLYSHMYRYITLAMYFEVQGTQLLHSLWMINKYSSTQAGKRTDSKRDEEYLCTCMKKVCNHIILLK